MAYGFVIDLEKCVGCHGCSVACKGANGTPPTVTRSRVDRGTEGSYPNAVRTIRPMLCMMCENPPCVAVSCLFTIHHYIQRCKLIFKKIRENHRFSLIIHSRTAPPAGRRWSCPP